MSLSQSSVRFGVVAMFVIASISVSLFAILLDVYIFDQFSLLTYAAGGYLALCVGSCLWGGVMFYSDQLTRTARFMSSKQEIESFLPSYFLVSSADPDEGGTVKMTSGGKIYFCRSQEPEADDWVAADDLLSHSEALEDRMASILRKHLGRLRVAIVHLHEVEFHVSAPSNHQRLEALARVKVSA